MSTKKTQTIVLLRKKNPKRITFEEIPGIDTIVLEEDGRSVEKTIAYIPGRKSIFIDDDESNDLAKVYEKCENIRLTDSFKNIAANELNLLKYLELCSYNQESHDEGRARAGSTALFKFVNYEKDAGNILDKENLVTEARYKVMKMDVDELKALIMLSEANPKMIKMLEGQSEKQIRHHALVIAKRSPEKVLNDIEKPEEKRRYYVLAAISSGIVELVEDARSGDSLKWTNGGTLITAARGVDVVDHLAKLSLSSDNEDEIIAQIKSKIGYAFNKTKKEEGTPDFKEVLISNLVDKGIIQTSGPWYKFQDGEEELKWKGKGQLIDALSDPETLAKFMAV